MRGSKKAGCRGSLRRMRSIVLVGVVCLMAGFGHVSAEGTADAGKPVAARTEVVESVRLPIYAVFPGTVVSIDRVEVSSRLSGYVYDLEVHEGQRVKKDQFLFAVDPTGVKAGIRRAKAGLAKAKAALAGARENYDRYKDLYRQQAATQEVFQKVETAYHVAQGEYQAARAALATARTQLKYAEVHSPFDGLVVSKYVDNGQLTSPGAPVLVLEDPEHLQVEVQVSERAFAHLTLDQKVGIDFQEQEGRTHTVTGRVDHLVAAADPATHTHLVKIGLPDHVGRYSGEYALVNIQVGERTGIVVPTAAIYKRAGITGVFVVDSRGQARFRMVTKGKRMSHGTVILSGLFPGDRLVLSAKGPLANGVRIRVR
jgi:membrane fusion protein, multidrug efflux system